uniref:Serine/threonine-protein phosphatase 4 regulatory subunit 3 n=1 Tax=Cacopsylla melanoneura TaxID=428564 RepID=A0A8D8WLC7_9HEMI
MTDTRRRVKLYALNADRQWDDKGTGHVSSIYVEKHKGMSLLVRAEADGTLLLESKIQTDTAYQKQQDTLIVWSERDNYDLALSFQEKAGCDEIWEKICQVQGKDPSVEITQDIFEESEDERLDDMSDGSPPIELPPCEISRLEEIKELMQTCLASPVRKEKLAEAIESEGYIRKLVGLFHMCEDLENLPGLHCLYDVLKSIFLLNKTQLLDILFSDDIILDVVGCLEYDPALTTPKRHRHYLRTNSKLGRFKEVVPISNSDLLGKIHQTYRIQYIQDVVLPTPSLFEDNMLSTVSSFIYFNKIEIVTLIQDDEKFLPELLHLLMDENTNEMRRRDLALFLREYCQFSQNLQPQAKENFYKTLSSLGILPALEVVLSADDVATKNAAIDILNFIIEFSPSFIRDYTLQQAACISREEQDPMLVNVIIEQMVSDTDPELGRAVQLMSILKMLIDPDNMLSSINKTEKCEFLNYFYKYSIHLLMDPLLDNTKKDDVQIDSYHNAQLLGVILELLSFCVEHHSYHIKNFILNKDLLRKVLVLMKSCHTFLVLSSLRFMRKIIAMKDDFYNRYIIKGHLFQPVIDTFNRNKGRYNLLDSAVLELFEYIKLEDIKVLCSHIVETYGDELESIHYVQTFRSLRLKYNQAQDKLKDLKDKSSPLLDSVSLLRNKMSTLHRNSRQHQEPRQMDEDEEIWFNEEDSFEDASADTSPPTSTHSPPSSNVITFESIGKSLDKKCSPDPSAGNNGGASALFTNTTTSPSSQQHIPPHNNNNNNKSSPPPSSLVNNNNSHSSSETNKSTSSPPDLFQKKALVDYEEDSDEEEEGGGGGHDVENVVSSSSAAEAPSSSSNTSVTSPSTSPTNNISVSSPPPSLSPSSTSAQNSSDTSDSSEEFSAPETEDKHQSDENDDSSTSSPEHQESCKDDQVSLEVAAVQPEETVGAQKDHQEEEEEEAAVQEERETSRKEEEQENCEDQDSSSLGGGDEEQASKRMRFS